MLVKVKREMSARTQKSANGGKSHDVSNAWRLSSKGFAPIRLVKLECIVLVVAMDFCDNFFRDDFPSSKPCRP